MTTEGDVITINEKYEVHLNRSCLMENKYSVREVGTFKFKGFKYTDELVEYLLQLV